MKNKRSRFVDAWMVVVISLSTPAIAQQQLGRTESSTAAAAGGATTTADNVTVDEVRGSCWLNVDRPGRCSGLYALNVTRAECCALRPGSSSISHATGWTAVLNMTSRQYFYWVVVGHGVPGCQPCRSSCDGFQCGGDGSSKVCRMRHGQPRCVCAADCRTLLRGHGAISRGRSGVVRQRRSAAPASSWHGPVCAFDGRTYRNLCALARSNCRSGRDLSVEYIGPCQNSCENVTCPGGKHCAQDQNGVPHCIRCRAHCRSSPAPSERVCGGDGQTYSSLCALERYSCLTGRSVRLAYRGNCRPGLTCSRLSCGDGERCLVNTLSATPVCYPCDRPCVRSGRRPVCASDGLTYDSRCQLDRAACRRGVVIEASRAGRCDNGATTVGVTELDSK